MTVAVDRRVLYILLLTIAFILLSTAERVGLVSPAKNHANSHGKAVNQGKNVSTPKQTLNKPETSPFLRGLQQTTSQAELDRIKRLQRKD